jgi:hypothetical protein
VQSLYAPVRADRGERSTATGGPATSDACVNATCQPEKLENWYPKTWSSASTLGLSLHPRGVSFPTGKTARRARTCRMWGIWARAAASAAVKINGRVNLGRRGCFSPKTRYCKLFSQSSLMFLGAPRWIRPATQSRCGVRREVGRDDADQERSQNRPGLRFTPSPTAAPTISRVSSHPMPRRGAIRRDGIVRSRRGRPPSFLPTCR